MAFETLKVIPNANLRVTVPQYGRYSYYTKFENGYWVLKNGFGNILYQFKDESEREQKAQGMVDVMWNTYQKLQTEFWIHRTEHPEYYYKTHEEANFPHRAIMKGFVPDKKDYDPYTNWYGVSTYDPDRELIKDCKKIQFSLQGICMPFPENPDDKWYKVANAGGCKYMGIFENKVPIYQNWYGQFPDDIMLENFLK